MANAAQSNQNSPAHVSQERVLVLDFGSQYAQLIARRVREQHVFCEIVRHDITAEQIQQHEPRGLILSGGPSSVYEGAAPKCDERIFPMGLPVLGICYGMQLACQALGGEVDSTSTREYGPASCSIDGPSELFDGLPEEIDVWMSHGDQVTHVADDFMALARTATCPIAAVKHRERACVRPAVSPGGHAHALGRHDLAQLPHVRLRVPRHVAAGRFCARRPFDEIRERVGDRRVICGLSGGVDSSVTAALLYQAIGSQLSCILVDNGLLRKDEKAAVIAEFTKHFQDGPARRPRGATISDGLGGRRRAAGEAAADRPRVHRVLCSRRRQRSRTPAFSPRARCIPT